ncbi:MAG: IS1096 element passenger TnpR family protein [Cetobacterium sp.]|uniref:IS1096 element passenger TnpR family protein n=1 Tax=Cetobacterium sp. TaxID=2071632 RepID=UPI003F3B0304
MKVFRLKITLFDDEKEISRTIEVEGMMNLYALHQIIQNIFGYKEDYPHLFLTSKGKDIDIEYEDELYLDRYFKKIKDTMFYVFEDQKSYEFKVTLIGISPEDRTEDYPKLIAAKGNLDSELDISDEEVLNIKSELDLCIGGFKNLTSKELLEEIKEADFSLVKPLIKEILRRTQLKELLEKDLDSLLLESKDIKVEKAAYLFNLFILLAEMKSENLAEKFLEIVSYSDEDLHSMFGEFTPYLKFCVNKTMVGNEKLYYEAVMQNETPLTINILGELIRMFNKTKNPELNNYLIEIASTELESEAYSVLRFLIFVQNGYSKIEKLMIQKMEEIKDEALKDELKMLIELAKKNRKKKGFKKKDIYELDDIFNVYLNIFSCDGDKYFSENLESRMDTLFSDYSDMEYFYE